MKCYNDQKRFKLKYSKNTLKSFRGEFKIHHIKQNKNNRVKS
jgi:hypothetical protein